MKKNIVIISFLLFVTFLTAQNAIDYVNLFIATADDYGQNDPSAAVPYGMVKVSPDTDPKGHSGYNYENTLLMGFSVNRIAGVGCRGTGGNLRIRPLVTIDESYVFLNKVTEEASPGYYSVELSNGIRVELTATNNMAIERYYFGENDTILLEFDYRSSFANLIESEFKQLSSHSLIGDYQAKNVCNIGKYAQYYNLTSNIPFRLVPSEKPILEFVKKNDNFIEIRIALSGIDRITAQKELELQAALTFDWVRNNARKQWSNKLNKIQVEGTKDEKTMFYTSLYRTLLSPVSVTSHDGMYRNSKGELKKADGFTYMSSWSLWDTYRTKFPLMSLLDPQHYQDVCRSLVELYRSGKFDWASDYETTPTVRTEHAIIILLDAYRKGIKGFDLKSIIPQIEEEVANLPLKSPDNYLESAYDIWAVANIFKELKLKNKSGYYALKADSIWRIKWIEKFKDINPETFDIMHGDGLYEGTLWQYRWAIPFAINQTAELVGGKKILAEQLEYFFQNNLYSHGNQPDIHAAFIFNHLDRPDLTQKWVTRILTEPMLHRYGTHEKFETPIFEKTYKPIPRGFIYEMDDDDGTMSAWYVWASMGLYPLVIGEPFYEISLPLFQEVSIELDNGKRFTIKRKTKDTIKKIYFNKREIKDFRLYHKDILKGGILELL